MSLSHQRNRKPLKESHQDSHRWVISYADFITLLFAFFVVMYAMSQVNEAKYRVLSDSLQESFSVGGNTRLQTMEGSGTRGDGIAPTAPIDLSQLTAEQNTWQAPLTTELEHLSARLDLGSDMQVSQFENRIEISLNSNILFATASAEPNYTSEVVFEELARLLKPYAAPVEVQGHSDNQPIQTAQFPSNWQLSAARAANVVWLLQDFGLDPKKLSAAGYGEYHPLVENETEAGRAANRRVVLVVHKQENVNP